MSVDAGFAAARLFRGGAIIAVVATAYTAGTVLLSWGVRAPLAAVESGSPTLEHLLTLGAAGLAWVCLSWLTATLLASVAVSVLTWTRGRWQGAVDLMTPALVRRLVAAALGTAIVVPATGAGAAASPSSAAYAAQVVASRSHSSTAGQAALPILDRPAEVIAPTTDGRSDLGGGHVIVPGDTLWDIAAAALPEGASDADIARAWPRWYDANAATIGADPDLIHPGHILQPPPDDPRPTAPSPKELP